MSEEFHAHVQRVHQSAFSNMVETVVNSNICSLTIATSQTGCLLLTLNPQSGFSHTQPTRLSSCFTESGILIGRRVQSGFLLVNFKTYCTCLFGLSMQLFDWRRGVSCGGKPRHVARSCWFLSQRRSLAHLYFWRGKETQSHWNKQLLTHCVKIKWGTN